MIKELHAIVAHQLQNGLPSNEILARIKHIAEQIPQAVKQTVKDLKSSGITHHIVSDLATRINTRASQYC